MKRLRWLLSAPLLILASALILLAPLLLRALAGSPLIPGPESYVQSGNAYGLLLRMLAPLGESRVMASVLLGIVAALLFRRLAGRLFRRQEERIVALLLFIINPLYLALFTGLSPFSVALPLALLAAILFLEGRRRWLPLLLAFTAAFAPLLAALLLLCLLLFGLRLRLFVWGAALSILVTLFLPARHLLPLSLALPVTEFGAILGISALYVALALFEGIILWPQRLRRRQLLFLLLLLLLAPFDRAPLLLAAFAAVPFAASFTMRLLRHRWRLREARAVTLLLLGCSFLFLLLTHSMAIAAEEPRSDLVTVLRAVKPGEGAILAPPELAPLIRAYTGHEALLGARSCVDDPRLCADVAALYRAWRLPDAGAILDRRGIRYLLITREMREGGVWTHDEEGLLFLLAHSERFKKVAASPEEELWRYDQR